jgi:membrane-associated phospholipid phosphatase
MGRRIAAGAAGNQVPPRAPKQLALRNRCNRRLFAPSTFATPRYSPFPLPGAARALSMNPLLLHSPWHLITRLGEAQVLLPAFAAVLAWLALRSRAFAVAQTWALCLVVATLITTVTKVAFIGWGIGYAPLDFTGISGHSMFSATVLPLLFAAAASTAAPRWHRIAPWLGYATAGLISLSRVIVHAHSPSEAVAGFALGGIASALALRWAHAPSTPVSKALLTAWALWFLLMPVGAPRSHTHSWVIRLALAVSGHERPYTRAMLQAGRPCCDALGSSASLDAAAAPAASTVGGFALR